MTKEGAEASLTPETTLSCVRAEPELPAFDVITIEEEAGQATVKCGVLTNGSTTSYEGSVLFTAKAALWDEQGTRMGLEDERHSQAAIAKVGVKMRLHAFPETHLEAPS